MSAPRFPRAARTTSDDSDVDFAAVSRRMQAIARRILRNRAEAEDVVQEAWVRWQTCDRSQVRNPAAFLVTATKRLALNTAQSARARREMPAGDLLPDVVDDGQDPTAGPEQRDAVDAGVSRLLQRLSPQERAAFVLRHAFDYPYSTIAAMLDLTEVNTRQLVSRAGKHLESSRVRPVNTADKQRLVAAFRAAAETGDVAALEQRLAA